MKNKLLAIILTTYYITLLAQSPINGTIWHYSTKDRIGKNGKFFTYKIVGDTNVAGKSCKVISGGFGCSELPSIGEILSYEGKKVFWYDRTLRIFKLLYDFGANKGDVLKLGLQKGSAELFNVQVDSVRDITIGAETFRIQFLKQQGPNFNFVFGGEAIERAGCTFNFFPQVGACAPLQNGGLRCYFEPNKAFFKISLDPCDLSPIDEALLIKDNNISIYPNPAQSELNLLLEKPILNGFQLEVVSTLNTVIYSKKYTDVNSLSIDTNNWQSGFYTIILRTSEGKLWINKFVKI